MNKITREETEALVQTWRNRVDAMSYKPGSKTCATLEIEFFVGAFAMLAALGRNYPPMWNVIHHERTLSFRYPLPASEGKP